MRRQRASRVPLLLPILAFAAFLLAVGWPLLAGSSGAPTLLVDQTVADGRYSLQGHTHVAANVTDFTTAVQTVGDARYALSAGNVRLRLTAQASPPSSPAEGDLYSDTSHALCWYDGSAWQKLSGAGTCS